MKLKKCMKRISAILLAATMVVVALPNQPVVKADEDDFPDEILFPISILDFPADNLFFEGPMNWGSDDMNYASYLDLYDNISGINSGDAEKGKNLVADHLESDPSSIYYRLPVYNEKTVDFIAKQVLKTLEECDNSAYAFNNPYVDGIINPLSMKNYIRKKDWKVLNAEDGTLANNAEVRDSNTCLKGKFVGNLGGPEKGSVTFKYTATFAGNHDVRFFPITAEARDLYITVNGGAPQKVSCASTGSWDTPSQTPVLQSVSGFIIGNNTIVISGNPSGTDWAPDLDRIEIANTNATADPALGTYEAEDNVTGIGVNGNAIVTDNNYFGNRYYNVGWWQEWAYTKTFNFTGTDGYYDLWVYYSRSGDDETGWNCVRVNGNQIDNSSSPLLNKKTSSSKVEPKVLSHVYLKNGDNTISYRGGRIRLDRYEVHKYTDPASNPNGYPLGNYAESKAKYNIDEDGDKISDYGWYDIETCYDYAYFITANLFKYHPSLNTAYGNYNNLVFHRVEQNGKYYYEFMADRLHNEKVPWYSYKKHYGTDQAGYKKWIDEIYDNLEDDGAAAEKEEELNKYTQVQKGIGRLIYNPANRSIRNACDADGNYSGPKEGEYETTSGSMYVCDGDAYNQDKVNNYVNHYAGEGIKRYPTYDPPKKSEDLEGYDDLYHNFNYTIRTHSRFVYKEGADQKFFFSGDDDVYVFINGNLLVDLGGQHSQLNGSFNLDTLAEDPKYGLINGKAVDFDFFYVERHSKESNFWGKMSFKLKNDEVELQWPDEFDSLTEMAIPYGWVVDLNYKFSSMRELTTNKNLTFSDQLGDTIGANGFELGDVVKLKPDKKLVVTVHRAQTDGSYVDEVKEFTFADDHEFTADEVKAVTDYFKDLSFEQDDSVEISGVILDTSKKPFNDPSDPPFFAETEDPKIKQLTFQTKAEYDAYMTMGGTNSVDDTVAIHSEIKDNVTVKVLIGALKVSTRIEGFGDNFDVKKDLSAFGHFTLKREETEDDDSTPDVDESIVYENQFQIAKGDNNIVFDAEIPDPPADNTIYRDPLPKGTYKLKMDIDMLTGYEVGAEVWVDGEKIADIRRGDVKIVNGKEYSFDGIYIMIDPKIEGGKWVYPEVEYVLKAYRELNPLKDLT